MIEINILITSNLAGEMKDIILPISLYSLITKYKFELQIYYNQFPLSLFSYYFYFMTARYKDDTFHMLETFNKTSKRNTGFGFTAQSKTQAVRGKIGNTWDALHMTQFLNQSNYSNWSNYNSRQSSRNNSTQYSKHNRYSSSHDHFFKTTKDNKNVSKFGYTKMNPLVSLPQTSSHNLEVLKQRLSRDPVQRYVSPQPALRKDGKFLFQGNAVKFRVTDPLTLQYLTQKQPSGYQNERLKWLIAKRHPHGMTGIDHAESPSKEFYHQHGVQSVRLRQQPNSFKSHIIDRDWKSKGRVTQEFKDEYGFPKGKFIQQRKFRNQNSHGYNIVTNCQTQR